VGSSTSQKGVAGPPQPASRPSEESVLRALEAILFSEPFREAEILKRFLRYSVEHSLRAEQDGLKEYRLGLEVFDRHSDFDPRVDPVVRMTARRLRSKLSEYYEGEGRASEIRIEVPKGAYRATFALQEKGKPKPDVLPSQRVPLPTPFWRSPWAFGVVVLGTIAVLVSHFRYSQPPIRLIPTRRSVAVLGFENLSRQPDKEWLSTAFSEMLTTELAAGERVRMVSGETVAKMKVSLSLPDAGSYSPETLARIRRNADADDIVCGAYVPLGDGQVRLDLHLQDTLTGETLASISAKGSETEIDELVDRAGTSLREKLGLSPISGADAAAVKATLPSGPVAARLYSEGLARLREYDNQGARDLLEKALTLEPTFALGHVALASAWSRLGYDAKASSEAKKAFELSTNLRSPERLWIEGHYRELSRGPDGAVDTYRTLFQSFPDDLEYGLQLAYVEYHASRGQEALATIAQLRELPPPARDDPRLDVAEAHAAFSLGDYNRYQAASARGAEEALAQGARLLAAEALADDCWALNTLGHPKEAVAVCERAQNIFAAVNDRDYVAAVLNQLGAIQEQQGDLTTAKRKLEQAFAISQQVGDRDGSAAELGNLANILNTQGDLRGARRTFKKVLRLFREVGDKAGSSEALGDIGLMSMRLGDFSVARSRLEESLAIARETGNKAQWALDLSHLGNLRYDQGDLTGAETMLQQAESALRQAGDKKSLPYALRLWGNVLAAKADLTGARQKYEEALKIATEDGAKQETAQIQIALADLALDQGHFTDAERFCRQALQQFEAMKASDDEILARATLTQVLLAMRQTSEAQKELDETGGLLANSKNVAVRLRLAITAAQVHAAEGNPTQAARSLHAVLAESTLNNLVPYEFEARLALADIEAGSGNEHPARIQFTLLQEDAAARGFAFVAAQATWAMHGLIRATQNRKPPP
jgi:eukaryotic-like serine/threonine-protein kinase